MTLKRILIVAPAVLIILLLQSYFWVPTYDTQSSGNVTRATKYIEASIGDAQFLNPMVNSDRSSSRITDLVFDGLLELGPDLALAPKLASGWRVSERFYLLVDDRSRFPDGLQVSAEHLESRLSEAVYKGGLRGVEGITLEPESVISTSVTRTNDANEETQHVVELLRPARLRIELDHIDQSFTDRLTTLLGADYGQGLNLLDRVTGSPPGAPLTKTELTALAPLFEHNPVIDFHLETGVKFHDGHVFDAHDVAFTYDAIMNPKNLSPRSSSFEPVKSVEVINNHHVRVIYKRLFSPAIDAWTIGIIPEHLLNDQRLAQEMDERGLSDEARASFGIRNSAFNRNPIGTGPFEFVEWQSDEFIHLQRFDDYWRGPAQLRDYYFRIIPDMLTQEMEFLTGAIDRYAPQPHQVQRLKSDERYQAYSFPGFNFTYIGYNNRLQLFADPKVRRALGMALNVGEIIDYLLYDTAEQTTGPYPTNTDWYDHSITPIPYDPEQARRLLAEAGWHLNEEGWLEKDGRIFEFNLISNHGNAIRKAVLAIAQNSWRQLGIKCNTQLFEWAVFIEDFVNPSEFDAVVLGWGMSIDPDLHTIWHSSQSGFGQFNFIGYNNPEADDLIIRIRQEYDRDVQQQLAHQLHRIIAADQPYTFLYAGLATTAYDRKLVMTSPEHAEIPFQVPASGDPYYYFTRWTRAMLLPDN